MIRYHLVRCGDFNGYKNILFVMKNTDERFGTPNYVDMGEGKFDRKKGTMKIFGRTYKVFADWSVRSA